MLNYVSDLYSHDILRQAVRRLPSRLHNKWAEYCLVIRKRGQEPNLVHLEAWVQDRVLAGHDSYIPREEQKRNQRKGDRKGGNDAKHVGATETTVSTCPLCKGSHRFWKCDLYKKMSPTSKYEQVKVMRLCFNCFSSAHQVSKCSSRFSCPASGWNAKHHSTLHDHFVGRKKEEKEIESKLDSKDGSLTESEVKSDTEVLSTTQNCMINSSETEVFLQVVPVKVNWK